MYPAAPAVSHVPNLRHWYFLDVIPFLVPVRREVDPVLDVLPVLIGEELPVLLDVLPPVLVDVPPVLIGEVLPVLLYVLPVPVVLDVLPPVVLDVLVLLEPDLEPPEELPLPFPELISKIDEIFIVSVTRLYRLENIVKIHFNFRMHK